MYFNREMENSLWYIQAAGYFFMDLKKKKSYQARKTCKPTVLLSERGQSEKATKMYDFIPTIPHFGKEKAMETGDDQWLSRLRQGRDK